MSTSDRVFGIIAGVILIVGGIGTTIHELPTVKIQGLSAPVARWLGWPCILWGLAFVITNIRGLLADRKKHLAAIEKCKAERQRETESLNGKDSE